MRRIDHSFCRMNRVLCVRVFVTNQFVPSLCPADWEGGGVNTELYAVFTFISFFPFWRC